ncbi:hypothetical protein AKJ57_00595 [candidate division MSBL1 archaeon SCGC-AAA259A05]|uniref:Sm domain-containing protein n=1 Tax=candidate division MSBL1 archaeon SCGC-AAA259A05 TaxID=1698259 RepID=A0A133UBP6_9EURY|nr:hypothetical protein AKJ57_00595 [candidate division MSBL1 archaeon SCGC-AAA259A05]
MKNKNNNLIQMTEDKPISLEELLDKEITVQPKGKQKLRGTLTKFDDYMNLVLKNVKEYKDEELVKEYELVVVKGGNIQSITI